MRRFNPWFAALLSTCALVLRGATFEVDPSHPAASDDGAGTAEHPWKTVAKAAAVVQPGDVVLVHGGTYREQVVVKTSGTADRPIRFEAAPGAPVSLTGADRLSGFKRSDGPDPIYSVSWPFRFNTYSRTMTHPDDEYHRLIGRCEQVFVAGYAMRQVLSFNQLAPGTFFADVEKRTLSVWDSANQDLNRAWVEASTRSEILRVEGAYVQIRGFHFRYAANAAQHGAIVLSGPHDLLEDCVVEDTNASGAAFVAPDIMVRRCVFRNNGQLGFGANGAHRLLFSECVVENNNTKNFSRGWEAGGDKLVLSRDVVLERSCFVRNRGNGIWFDIGNEHATVRQCLIADNEDAGIFYEISFDLQAHDNVIVGNGFAQTPGAWGAQAGICLSSSPGALIERNLIAGNREGFNFREQGRTTPVIGDRTERPVWNHDELIRQNIIVENRNAQVWGWFDVADDRSWPAHNEAQASGAKRAPASISSGSAVQPVRNLKDLHLRFEDNVYSDSADQGGFRWGPTWRKHRDYRSLAEFQRDLGIDQAGSTRNLAFSNLAGRDFRLPKADLDVVADQYPRGQVPWVRLGLAKESAPGPQ